MTAAVAAFLCLLPAAAAPARGFCSEPIEPYCPASAGVSTTIPIPKNGACRSEILRHLEKLVLFQRCILDQAAEVTLRIDETRLRLGCDGDATPCGDATGP